MPKLPQANPSGAALNANELPVFTPAVSGGQDAPADSAAPGAPCNFPDKNNGEETGYLLKLIASLESCNMGLLNRLNQAERELAMLRKPAAHIRPETGSNDNPAQLYGWERKLTRMGWRPPP